MNLADKTDLTLYNSSYKSHPGTNVRQMIEEDFTKKTGLSLPPGYERE